MGALSSLGHDWLPPAIVRWVDQRTSKGIRFEGDFSTWEEAAAKCTGYEAEGIVAKVLAATIKVKKREAKFERDSVLFDEIEFAWPVLSGLLWSAARHAGKLSVLDFGGALGSSFFQHREVLQSLPELCWNVVEQPHYAEAGTAHIQSEQLRFFNSIENCLGKTQPNAILLSSVLQYLPDPMTTLRELIAIGADTVIIDRTIVNQTSSSRIYVQSVPPSIYSASYPCWSLSESSLIESMAEKYRMVADFPSLPFPALLSIDSEFKGYLFQKLGQ